MTESHRVLEIIWVRRDRQDRSQSRGQRDLQDHRRSQTVEVKCCGPLVHHVKSIVNTELYVNIKLCQLATVYGHCFSPCTVVHSHANRKQVGIMINCSPLFVSMYK